jgi:hypothetical protein
MKAILSMALLLVLCGVLCGVTAAADDKIVDPVGTWKIQYDIGDQHRTATLTITKDGDNLAGTMNWPDQKDEKLKDVILKDADLTFSAERKLADNSFHVEYKFTINGDKLKGKGAVDNGGDKTEFDIAGEREKKDK